MHASRKFIVALLILTGTTPTQSACAQGARKRQAAPAAEQTAAPAVDVAALVEDARQLPPEFAADALIRLASSQLITEVKRKQKLLDEAFLVASSSQQPVRLVSIPGAPADSHAGFRSRAAAAGLDALSLRSRAVLAMLPVNKQRAREMFAEVAKPRPAPLDCEDALVPDISAYYNALSRVAQTAFSPQETKQEDDLRFVEQALAQISSPVEISPAAGVILALNTSPQRLDRLTTTLARALKDVRGDDRTFSAAETAAYRAVAELLAATARQNTPTKELNSAARDYFVRHLKATRCADELSVRERNYADGEIVKFFNDAALTGEAAGVKLLPISQAEATPVKVEGAADIKPYWTSSQARNLLQAAKALNFGSGTKKLTAEERAADPDWSLKLTSFLDDMADWDETHEASFADYFHQRCILYNQLLDLATTAAERNQVLVRFLAFLQNPAMQQDNRVEWYLQASGLIAKVLSLKGGDQGAALRLLERSENQVIKLYATLDRLIPGAREEQNQALPAPSLAGNTAFKLRGFQHAKSVTVAGSFNDWNPTSTVLARQGDAWVCRINLAPGKHAYKFVVDGAWMTDPDNPNIEDDGNGNRNSVLFAGAR